jgi:hypothetical protein
MKFTRKFAYLAAHLGGVRAALFSTHHALDDGSLQLKTRG